MGNVEGPRWCLRELSEWKKTETNNLKDKWHEITDWHWHDCLPNITLGNSAFYHWAPVKFRISFNLIQRIERLPVERKREGVRFQTQVFMCFCCNTPNSSAFCHQEITPRLKLAICRPLQGKRWHCWDWHDGPGHRDSSRYVTLTLTCSGPKAPQIHHLIQRMYHARKESISVFPAERNNSEEYWWRLISFWICYIFKARNLFQWIAFAV